MRRNPVEFLHRAHAQGLGDGFINFWAGLIDASVDPLGPTSDVLEFGAVSAKFLQLLFADTPYRSATGVVLPADAPDDAERWSAPSSWPGRFVAEAELPTLASCIDVAFSSEVFGLVHDLRAHAAAMRAVLRPGGSYYTSFGWHGDNPHVHRHADLRRSRGLSFNLHSLDDVAHAFHAAGFEVGVKRLRMPYFLMFEPELTRSRFGSVADMITCLEDHRIAFSFRHGGSP